MHGLVLLIPDKPDEERDAVAAAWEQRGGSVLRLGRFWDPPGLDPASVRVYGADTFCLVLAEKLGLRLVSPDDRALSNALPGLLGRRVQIRELGRLDEGAFPAFVKPVVPKQFRGAVYTSIGALAEETLGLDPSVEVMVSEVVKFTAEARAFVLDGEVRGCAIYEGEGDVSHAAVFARVAAGALGLPRTCVVDVGLLEDGRWVVVECNATWGAGLNGCDAGAVVDCIEAAVADRNELDVEPDCAFDIAHEVLAGRRWVRLNGGASKVLQALFSNDTDTHITKEKLATRLGRERRFPVEYIREAGPAVLSAIMESARVANIDSATYLQLPASTVPVVQRFPAWSYESKSIWILPSDSEIVLIIRSASPEATEPSASLAPRDGRLAPRLLPPWEPEPARFHTFDSARDCPHCGEASQSYREYRDCLVCAACGRSFTLADNARSRRT